MIYVVWEFTVAVENVHTFETAYGGNGTWAELFHRDSAYHKTILIKDIAQPRRYMTIDVWEDKEAYLSFKARFATDYEVIDKECESLTASEREIGIFDALA